MVGRAYFTQEEEMPPLHHFSSRGGYPSSHDRELPSSLGHDVYRSSRAQHLSSHDSRSSNQRLTENDSSSRPRSRIPVACGRCRKRKIKCSGDNGGPCTNCKSAQHDQCQFLRVSSMDAQMKTEVPSYDYDTSGSASSRQTCRMPVYGSYMPPNTLGVDTSYPYRSNPLLSYPFQQKNYYSVPSFGDYGEVEYDIHGSSYQVFGAENLTIPSNFNTPGAGRSWHTTPQLPRNALFIEQSDTQYSHSQMSPYSGSSFPMRTAINSDTRNITLNSNVPSLPTPLTADRLLPIPATNRQVQVVSFHRPIESGIPTGPAGYQSYDCLRSGLKTHTSSAGSETESLTSSYLPMPSSSPESIASSQMPYVSQQLSISQQQQQSELYTPPGNDGLYQNESSDSSYGPSSSGSKRGSHSSQTTTPETPLPPIASDTLANGHRYVPYHSSTGYPAPPLVNSISAGAIVHQASIAVD